MGLGISSADWQDLSQDFINSKTYAYKNTHTYNPSQTASYPMLVQPTVSQETGNACTDGKDDGKIGLAQGIYYVGKGAAKGIINGLKGCVTDSNGKFSLAKTIGTVALGAACIAFPAVGLAACAIGAVTGGAKLVTGVVDAARATTDAAKKDALENVGDGGLTLALSVTGAKASYRGVVSGAAKAGGSAIETLGENATTAQKMAALLKDMKASTKFNFSQAKNAASNMKEALEITRLKAQAAKIGKAPTEEEMTILRELQARTSNLGNQEAISMANKVPTKADVIASAKSAIKGSFAKLTEGGVENVVNNIKNTRNAMKLSAIKSTLSAQGQAVLEFLQTSEGTYAQAVQKFGYQNVLEALEVFASYRMLDESI